MTEDEPEEDDDLVWGIWWNTPPPEYHYFSAYLHASSKTKTELEPASYEHSITFDRENQIHWVDDSVKIPYDEWVPSDPDQARNKAIKDSFH